MPAFEIDNKNYATDREQAAKALEFVKKVTYQTMTDRQVLDERYLQYYNIFRCVFDVRFYEGTSQVYIPELRKNVEAVVTRIKKALFPTDDLFAVEPTDPDDDNFADVIQSHLKWQINKRVKLKAKIDRFLRQLVMFGWSPVRCNWERDIKKIVGLQKNQEAITKQVYNPLTDSYSEVETGEVTTTIEEVEKEFVKKNNPSFDPIDILSWYMYPSTANSVDDAYGVFELSKVARWELFKKQENDEYANVEEIKNLSADSDDLWVWKVNEKEVVDGLNQDKNKLPEIPYYTVVNYWGMYNWGTDEKPDEQPTVITTVQNKVCIQLRKNPFYDQEPPYLQARFTELINEAYPSGLIEPLAQLQYYMNDTANQTFDSILYSLNPIVKYDPGRVVNINSIAFAPGAMWALADMDAVQLDRPPDVSNTGFNAMAQAQQHINSYPGLQNIPTTGRRAATHISAIQEEYSLPILSIAENLEEQVMSPWLAKAYRLNQQFLDDEEIFLVTGKDGIKNYKKLSPEMLVGDYNFYWRGANQATNIHVRARQMNEYLSIATPLIPYLQQKGYELNVPKILKRIWKDGLGFDGEDEILKQAREDRSIDPETENIILAHGKKLPISMNDDDEQHIQAHDEFKKQADAYGRKELDAHIQEHKVSQQQKQAMSQMQTSQGQRRPMQSEGRGEVQGERDLESIQPASPF